MYYPIIDKLKEVMARIDEGGSSALIIEGTVNSDSGSEGTWTGNWNDIISSLQDNIPVYFKVDLPPDAFFAPLVFIQRNSAATCMVATQYIQVSRNNTFSIISV